jgi:hypothetical protein
MEPVPNKKRSHKSGDDGLSPPKNDYASGASFFLVY